MDFTSQQYSTITEPGVVFITPSEENADAEGVEIPLDGDNTCNLKTVQSQFASAVGLRYRSPDSGRLRALRMDEEGRMFPPAQGWGDLTFVIVADKKRTREDEETKSSAVVESSGSVSSEIDKESDKNIGDLIILGLSYKASEGEVREYFKSYGEIKNCEIKKDFNGNSRGFGFISYVNNDSTVQCMKDMYHHVAGRKCEVRVPKRLEHERKLFVGRLPRGTTEEDLQEYFTTFGTLADVYIPKPPRGFAFVTFEKGDVAEAVLGQKHFLRDMQLNVTIPDPPAKKQKFAGGQDEGYGGQPQYGGHGYKQQQPQFPQYQQYPEQNQQYGYGQQQSYGQPQYVQQPAYQHSSHSQPQQQPPPVAMQSEDSGVPGLDADEIDLLDKLVKKAKAGRKGASQVPPQHW